MKKSLTLALVTVVALTGVVTAQKVARVERPADIPSFVGYVQDEFVIVFKEDVGKLTPVMSAQGVATVGVPDFDAISRQFGVSRLAKQFKGSQEGFFSPTKNLARYHKAKFERGTLEEAMAAFLKHPMVDRVDPIGIHTLYAAPNDGWFSDQWHLHQANDHDVDAPEAWDVETGSSSLIIAILDTGVRYFHKDLGGANASYTNPTAADGNMWINSAEKNGTAGVDDDGNGYVDDWIGWDWVDNVSSCWTGEDCSTPDNDPRDFNGHGTHCAGNGAAITNNGYATCGIAGGWGEGTLEPAGNGVKIMTCRIGWSGVYVLWEVGYVRMDFAAQAFYYAADKGAKIASCSWGSSNTGGISAAIDYFLANGGMIFHAAGNDDLQIADYMGSRTDIINVAATDGMDCKAAFSNYGSWVDISAPGTGVWSSYHSHDDPQNDYVAPLDGTSMACPLAAGVAALVWSRHPDWSASQVEQRLYETADDIDSLACNSSYSGKLGAGRVNAFNAVNDQVCEITADFSGSPTSGCVPLIVNFTDQSSGLVTSWQWYFGDGGSSTDQNPSYQYTNPGSYDVTLMVCSTNCCDTITKANYIAVSGVPTADFQSSPASGCAPLTADFTDLSTGNPTSWGWDFGDGGTSFEQNPTYTYENPGTYTVALTVSNSCGSDGAMRVDYIQVDSCGGQKAFALSDIPVKGTVTGNYTYTHSSDNGYEVITEVESGGKPSRRYSRLDHRWDFNVAAGATVTFNVEAFRPDNTEGDDFIFEYSTDNENFTPLLAVNGAAEQLYSATFPTNPSGIVYIRVIDADHTAGNRSFDNIYIDYLYIESGGTPPPPDTMYVGDISVDRIGGKANKYQGRAIVTVYDHNDQPVVGALVEGHFNGPSSDSKFGMTGSGGKATIVSQKVRKPVGVWCFTVDNLTLGSNIYDPSRNIEVTDCEASGSSAARIGSVPTAFALSQNYPNPFNPTTEISFNLPRAAHAKLQIFNVMGEYVTTLVDGYLEAGVHTVMWDGSVVASGVYLFRLQADDFVDTRKMTLVK